MHQLFSARLFVAAIFVAACSTSAFAQGNTHVAGGFQGAASADFFGMHFSRTDTLVVNVVQNKNGVTGKIQWHSEGDFFGAYVSDAEFRPVSMRREGNRLYLVCEQLRARYNGGAWEPGLTLPFAFWLEDNGEGASSPDTFSAAAVFDESFEAVTAAMADPASFDRWILDVIVPMSAPPAWVSRGNIAVTGK